MKHTKIILTVVASLLLFNLQDCFATVTSMTNSLLPASSFSPAQTVPIFRDKVTVVRVKGSWLDTTNDIDAEGLNGQPAFGISIKSKGNTIDPYVEFQLNSNRPGRYRVRLKRPGGEDVITIEYTDHIALNNVQILTLSNATPAYLDAYAKDTELRMRLTGTNVNRLVFKPIANLNYTIANETIGNATTTQKDIGIKYSRKSDKLELRQRDFVFIVAGREFRYSDYKGNQLWSEGNLPFFRVYDKPDFTVSQTVTGIYNRKQGSCFAINQGGNFLIENPLRCVTEFNIANPTAATPQTEKIVTIPDVKFTIINDSYAPQFSPITVHVKFGLNILATITIPRMIAQESRVISFRRAESRKRLVRNVNCAECFEFNEVPFNWIDQNYTVVVDPGLLIPEDSEFNNSRTFTGSQTLQ